MIFCYPAIARKSFTVLTPCMPAGEDEDGNVLELMVADLRICGTDILDVVHGDSDLWRADYGDTTRHLHRGAALSTLEQEDISPMSASQS